MKNHWTDQKLISDFITELSENIAPIMGIDAKVISAFLNKDVVDNPPDDEDLNQLRASKDDIVKQAVAMLSEDEAIRQEFKAALDDGLW